MRDAIPTRVHPEPTVCQLSSGTFARSRRTRICMDDEAAAVMRDARAMIDSFLPETDGGENGGRGASTITLRTIRPDDLRRTAQLFGRPVASEGLTRGSCFVDVTEGTALIAADTREGFIHAREILRQGSAGLTGAGRLRRCFVFDRPFLEVRAVRLSRFSAADAARVPGLLSAMAGLAYNTLIVERRPAGLPARDWEALRAASAANGVDLVEADQAAADLADITDGPRLLDWEHRSRAPGVVGGVVRYEGDLSAGDMARRGLPWLLAYCASMLCDPDYDNFSWERVHEVATAHAPVAMARIEGVTAPLGPGLPAMSFPVPLAAAGFPSNPVLASARDGEVPLAAPGERVDGLVFRHALVPALPGRGSPSRPAVAGPVAFYRISHGDGSTVEIPLVENVNIARSDLWPGRRYDALSHRFSVDERLHAVSCHARPVVHMGDDGRPSFRYDMTWRNGAPDRPVIAVSLVVMEAAGDRGVRVDEIFASFADEDREAEQ